MHVSLLVLARNDKIMTTPNQWHGDTTTQQNSSNRQVNSAWQEDTYSLSMICDCNGSEIKGHDHKIVCTTYDPKAQIHGDCSHMHACRFDVSAKNTDLLGG